MGKTYQKEAEIAARDGEELNAIEEEIISRFASLLQFRDKDDSSNRWLIEEHVMRVVEEKSDNLNTLHQ